MREKTLYEACPLCASADFSHLHTGDCSRHPLYQKPLSTALPWNKCEKCGHYRYPDSEGGRFERHGELPMDNQPGGGLSAGGSSIGS